MLAKLLRLDIQFAYKKFLSMAAVLLAIGVLAPLFYEKTLVQAGMFLIFMISIFVVCIMSIWLIVQHFHKNLFGTEGYLMFSLPVTTEQLVLSKLLTTVMWFNLMVISAIVMVTLINRQAVTLAFFMQLLQPEILKGIAKAAFMVNINVIPIILATFFGISMAVVTVRNKKLGLGFGAAFAVAAITLYNWASIKISGLAPFTVRVNDGLLVQGSVTPHGSLLVNTLTALCFSALFFILITYVMKRRLNLD